MKYDKNPLRTKSVQRILLFFLLSGTFCLQRILSRLLFLDTFELILDQDPYELSATGAKRGVRIFPVKTYRRST